MAYTLTNITDDIRNYTEVDSGVLTTAVVNRFIQNAENRIYREVDSDDNRHYATSNLAIGNRYVTIPSDLRKKRYQLYGIILRHTKHGLWYTKILC